MERVLPTRCFVKFYRLLVLFFLLFSSETLFSQTQGSGITSIYTDYNGYWTSSASSISTIKPDNDHNVLGFTWNNNNFSTGVNDATLTAKGISFTPVVFQAFPVRGITLSSPSLIILGQLKDGVNAGASTPAPFTSPPQISNLLTDGTQGLNIGTGVIDVPSGTPLIFDFGAIISVSKINDNIPDLLITQVGLPTTSSASDKVYFIDANGNMVGNSVSIDQSTVSSVGNWSADLYNTDGTLASNYTKTDRPLRVWAADVAAFGITSSNYLQATALKYVLSGFSDPAFLAFNTRTIQVFSANDDAATTNIGTPVAINVLNNDVPSSAIDASSVTITTQPQYGSVTVSSTGVVTYTPNAGYYGNDSFDYQVFNSNRSQSDVAHVTVTVGGPVAAPVFNAGSTSTRCQGSGQSTYTATATNSTGISYSLSPAAAGTINASSGLVTWSATFSGTAIITATASEQGGPQSSTFTVTVNPNPTVTSAINGVICSNTAQNYMITSDVGGATFSWSRATVTGVSNAAESNQTSSTITETLINTTTAPVNVVYTIVPQANGCTGATFTYTLTVNPTPSVNNSSASICNNTAQNYTISSNVNNSTFSWSRAAVAGISNPAASNQTSSTITETLTNTTSAPVTVTYLITPTASGCTGNTSSYTLTVNPTASVTSAPSASVCNNTPQNYAITSDVSGATFSWSRAFVQGISNAAKSGQTSSNITESLINTTSAPIAVVYKITPQTSSCAGQIFTYTVTVNPTISVTSLPSTITCNNMAPNYTIASNVSGANFTWSRAAVTGISNAAVSGQTSNTITEVLNNTTGSSITVTYVIVPNFNGCNGNPFNYRVTVSPTPAITSLPNGIVCSNEAQSYSITSNISGTNFTWSRAEVPGISNDAADDQTSNTITERLVNTTSDPINVAYTIIAEASGCTSTPFTYTVTVNPTPAVTSAPTGIICSGSAQDYDITSNVSGAGFSWSRNAVTGISNAAVSNQTSNSITEALVNTTSAAIDVAYTIIPAANNCTGTSFTYTISVNPTPAVTSAATGVVCSGIAQTYDITSNVNGAGFIWSRNAVTGISNAAVSNQTSNSITETLVNTTSAAINVAYTIIPTANNCIGTVFTYTISVNPTPAVTSAASGVICSGNAQVYDITSNVSGASFSWSRSSVTGISNAAVSGEISSSITEALVNTTSAAIDVAYTIIPAANNCTGTVFTYTISVNPTPAVTSAASGVICSGTAQAYDITSNVSGAGFSWSRNAVTGISNAAVSNQTSSSITEALINTTSAPINVAYTIIPAANNCTGTVFTYTISVNPTPVVTSAATGIICSGTAQAYDITSNVTGASFTWSRAAITGISNAAVSNQTSSSITEALINTTSAPIDVAYTIVPTANNCTGTVFTYTVSVNPTPAVTSAASGTICSGIAQAYYITSNVSGASFSWSRSAVTGISNAAVSNQTSNSITEALVNTTSAAIDVAYTIIPTANNCTGTAFTYTISVNPTPAVTSAASGVICSGSAQAYDITSNVSGAGFIWSRNAVPGISNAAVSGETSNSITEALVNTTSAPIDVAYTIVPAANGCTGTAFTYTISVNPTPAVTSATNGTICNETAQNYNINSNLNNATFSWSRAAVNGISNPATSNQTSNSITEALVNTTSASIDVAYTIIPDANGCTGSAFNYTVTVMPTTDPAFHYSTDTFCKTGTNPVPVTASSSGGTFSASFAGLVFADNHTGEINLSASTAGSYTITFVTNTTCVYSSSLNITITNGPDATFSYNGPFCQQQTNPLPVFLQGSSAGIFSSADAGLIFSNISTGEIDLQRSIPGTYTVRNDIAAANGCAATFATATVTINPLATVNAGEDQTVCAGQTVILNGFFGGGASSATWSGGTGSFSDPSSIQTVYTLGAGETHATLYLTTNDPAGPCGAAVDELQITVNPIPAITSPVSGIICSGTAQAYDITSNVTGASFTWSRAAITGISNAAVSNQTSSSITEALINTTSAPIDVAYTIVPTANNCTGTVFTYTVSVNPTPAVTSAASGTICSGIAQAYYITSNVSGASFSWSRSAVTGISNAAVSNQTSNSITEALVNTTSAAIDVAYTIVPAANGCTGTSFTYTVSVNPTPAVTSVPTGVICSGTAQAYDITSNVNGASFIWSRNAVTGISNAAVSGETSNSITEALINTTSAAIDVAYTIIPTANNCTGTVFTYTISVNPTPAVTSTPSGVICSGSAQAYDITSNVNGAGFSWSRNAVTGISNFATSNQTSNSITEALVNTTSAAIDVAYTIIPAVNNCTGTAFTYTISVNPTPAVSNTSLNQVVCSEGNSTPVTLLSNVAGTNFIWTATATSGITGFTTTGNTDVIPAQTLVNAGTTTGTVTYTIKPFYYGCEGRSSSYTITVNPKPATPTANSNSPVCNGTSLMLTTPAVADASYNWTGPNGFTSNLQNPVINNAVSAAQGTYSLTVIVNGCSSNTGTTNVIINPTPTTPVAAGNTPVCAGETLNLTASTVTDATYSWTGPNGFTSSVQNPVINNAPVAASGVYTVKAIVNGCSSADGTVAITVNPIPASPTLSSNSPVCATSSLNLTAASVASASYSWTGPNGFTSNLQNPVIPSATPENAGTYYATASSNGCTSPAASIKVVVTPALAAPVLSSNSPVCSGNSITISCTTYDGVIYNWSGPNGFTSTQQNPEIDNAVIANQGRYTVVITTPGCSVTNTSFIDIKVNQTPTAPVASNNSPVCISQTLKLAATTVNGAIYNWTGPNGFTSNLQNPEITNADLIQAGKYAVTVTVNGCTSNAAATTVIINKPAVVFAGDNQTVCANNAAVTLSGNITGSSTTGIWSTNGSGSFSAGNTSLKGSYMPSAADITNGTVTLTLTATNTAPCSIASSSFKITITPTPVVFAGNDQAICMDDEAILNGQITKSDGGKWSSSGTGTFTPSNSSLNAHYIPSEKDKTSGSVILTLTANGNCIAVSDQLKISLIPAPKVNAGANLYVTEGEKVVLQPAAIGTDLKYSWTPNLYLNDNTLKNPVFTGLQDITYTLTVTGTAGCVAQDQIFIKVLKPLIIPNTFTPNGDGINDTWTIKELENYPDITVRIFNRYGMQLFYSQGYSVPWNGTYNGQPLPVGTYYYIIDLKTYGKLRSGPVTVIR